MMPQTVHTQSVKSSVTAGTPAQAARSASTGTTTSAANTQPKGAAATAASSPVATPPAATAPTGRPVWESRRSKFYGVCATALLVSAGLVWLALTSELAATGRRIAELDAQRGDLLERRSVALAAYAAATDPRALGRAATAQGFGPPTYAVEYLGVAVAPVASGPARDARPGSPLDIMRAASAANDAGAAGATAGSGPLADMPAMLLSVGAAEPAAADTLAATGQNAGQAAGQNAGEGAGQAAGQVSGQGGADR
jgi:hypothetical protein